MAKTFENLKKKFKNIKFEHIIAVLAIIAVVGFLGSSLHNEKDKKPTYNVENYVSMLEGKLSKNLSRIKGAGNVSVIISVKKGLTSQIATETSKNNNSSEIQKEVPILVGGKPIILSEIYPEITGVVVIAKGADHLSVKMALMSATQTFLDVTSDKIEILTMKN